MKYQALNLTPESRWHVPFQDTGSWRTGIYRPEFNSSDEIKVLEKHTCPELFVCMKGRMGLLIKDGSREELVEMEPNQAIFVTGSHNGFAIDPEGFFLVVERTSFSTEYIDRITGTVIERVTVQS